MKKSWFGVLGASLMAFMLVLTPGCNVSKDNVVKVLTVAGDSGAHYGLQAWSKKDMPSAKECATALKANINDVLMPYLNGGNLPSSAEVQAFINSSLFKNVKPEVKAAIVAAAIALDAFVQAPSPTTYLKQDEIDYFKAFFGGLSTGCDKFLAEVASKDEVVPVEGKWVK